MNDKRLTDAMQIETTVENALQADPTVGKYPITVAVQGSTVSLTGRVDSQNIKDAAEKIAYSVPGVLDVTNELVVGDTDDGYFDLGDDDGRRDGGNRTTIVPGFAGIGGGPGSGVGTGSGMQSGGVWPVVVTDTAGAEGSADEDTEDVRG